MITWPTRNTITHWSVNDEKFVLKYSVLKRSFSTKIRKLPIWMKNLTENFGQKFRLKILTENLDRNFRLLILTENLDCDFGSKFLTENFDFDFGRKFWLLFYRRFWTFWVLFWSNLVLPILSPYLISRSIHPFLTQFCVWPILSPRNKSWTFSMKWLFFPKFKKNTFLEIFANFWQNFCL